MLILEFNNRDKDYIKSFSNIFTISLEIELETDDSSGKKELNSDEFINNIKISISDYVLNIGENIKNHINLIDEILNKLDLNDDEESYEYNSEIFDDYLNKKDGIEKDIIDFLQNEYLSYYFLYDSVDYLKEKIKLHLPNFYKKWEKLLKFELDTTLDRGIEFSCLTYINGIEKSIEFINDFYSEFDNQNYWYMSLNTGIHVNIGINYITNWNIFKGMILISDMGEFSYIFKDMLWRLESIHNRSFLPELKKQILSNSTRISRYSLHRNLLEIENMFNAKIVKKMLKIGQKKFGFNITHIEKSNYVEFRYVGGKISREILIDKLYYFSHIVLLMVDKNYKRKNYLKRIYKLIYNL